VIFSILLGLSVLLITKLLKSNNKVKISLITVSIVVAFFGVQAYFMVDDVLLKKHRAIIWEDNEAGLIAELSEYLMEEGYEQEKCHNYAVCLTDGITMDSDYFKLITNQQDMFLFYIDSYQYAEDLEYCTNKKEITAEEKEAFENEMKELLGE
jgi:hypothetical protein